VPEVLTSGDHERVRRWRQEQALRATRERRPDLLEAARLTAEDERILRGLADETTEPRETAVIQR
jgi:tRNA (guanine37-N1)-methyltransferase